ncbi:MAG: Bor family protein [Gemmatimonadetes bacterium]|nr:Bor family protein [Gemmatimonadota bacterium]
MLRGVMWRRLGALTVLAVAGAGCYHATIETGLPPSDRTLEDAWAPAWIGGLVSPKTVETAERCPDGVAKVETQLSFLNQLVSVLTIGIYTPMSIKVTCAARSARPQDADGGAELRIPEGASLDEKQQALEAAAALSAVKGYAVFVIGM